MTQAEKLKIVKNGDVLRSTLVKLVGGTHSQVKLLKILEVLVPDRNGLHVDVELDEDEVGLLHDLGFDVEEA